MKVAVVIPVRNRLDLTKPLVEALEKDGGADSILVYDNGSTDGTADWLVGRGPVTHRVEAANVALHRMWNAGIEAAHARHGEDTAVVFLNNDLRLDGEPHWVLRLVDPLHNGWGATCPNYDGRRDWMPVIRLDGVCGNLYDGTGGLAGFAFAVAPSVLKTYRFPEEAKWWFGDTDLAWTLNDLDIPYGMVMGVGVEHIGGGSQTAKDHDLTEQCKADKAWFEAKWGVTV